MQELFVDTPEKLTSLCEQIKDSEWLAMDTEFIREKTYYPILCLIQISNGEVSACVDPIQLDDLQPLLDILYDGRIIKIWHAARQDLEIFLHLWGQIPLPLFDSQPAAALLGYGDQIGYANLVKQITGVELPKDQSRTDWSQRPLTEQQIRYALDDVIYLGDIYLRMRGELSDRGRLQWLADDFSDLANPLTYAPDPRQAWRKVKGKQHLRGRQLAVLQELADWREQQARLRDLPKKWVLKDEVMIELSRRLPTQLEKLSSIRGLEPAAIRRHGETLLGLIDKGAHKDRTEWPQESKRPKPLNTQQHALVDILSAALHLIAADHELTPMAIATQKDLQKLVRKDEDCALLDGWRKAVAGDTLKDIAEGRTQLTIDNNGKVKML